MLTQGMFHKLFMLVDKTRMRDGLAVVGMEIYAIVGGSASGGNTISGAVKIILAAWTAA